MSSGPELAKSFPAPAGPQADTLRLRVTILGANKTKGGIATATRVTPLGFGHQRAEERVGQDRHLYRLTSLRGRIVRRTDQRAAARGGAAPDSRSARCAGHAFPDRNRQGGRPRIRRRRTQAPARAYGVARSADTEIVRASETGHALLMNMRLRPGSAGSGRRSAPGRPSSSASACAWRWRGASRRS